MPTEKCPKCGSDEIIIKPKHNLKRCDDCKHEWSMKAPLPISNAPLSNALDQKVRDFCKNLAETDIWVPKVADEWPAPIAHEYHRLREILGQEQQIISAIWQLKDVAELLLKFPAVVMAQWILTKKHQLAQPVQRVLLAKPLNMGDWQHLARDTLANPLCQDWPPIAGLFRRCDSRKQKKPPTEFSNLLDEIIKWRNDNLGHGALALNVSDFQADFAELVEQLNKQLAIYQNVWDGMQLQDGEGQPLCGWQTIRHRHEQPASQHSEQDIALQLDLGSEILALSPWLTLKRCHQCQKQDVFFFDSRKGKTNRYQVHFLDYLAGHKMSRPGHLETQLAMNLPETVELPEDSDFGGEYGSKQLDDLLQSKSLEAEYLSPQYLRTGLKTFLENHDQGVYWLRAPAHIGKSLFVHGLRLEKTALIPGLQVATFHIRREYRYYPPHFKDYISEQLKDIFDLRAIKKELPQLDLEHAQPAVALSQWLEEMLAIHRHKSQRPDAQLLLCLDGLDELNQSESRTLLDFIPTSAQLAEGCYVLLTSRPEDGCPAWIWHRLHQQVQGVIADIDLKSAEYRQLLRQFFQQQLQERFANTAKSAQEQIFQQVVDRSEGRFLYVSLLCNLLHKNYNLNFTTLQSLPSGADLYQHYLAQIEQVLAGSKQWEYIKRLLLILTAAEQANVKDLELRTGNPQTGFEWPGISLEVVASWLGEAAVNSVRLVFALYSLKEILRVAKGRRYKLGLKGFTSHLQERWAKELVQEHRQLAVQFYGDWHERYEELELSDAALAYRFRHLLAHTELSEDAELKQQVWGDEGLANAYIGQGNQAYEKHSDFATALAYYGCAMRIYERLFADSGDDSLQNDLAAAYMNRGVALYSQGELAGAVRDYGVAIELREQLRQRLGKEAWPPQWQNSLAAAYMNRGVALDSQGELAGAVRDYGVAIELREQLRQRQGKEAWPPQWQNDLAKVYNNRGVALKNQGELAGAVRDYGVAIEFLEQLRQRLGKEAWPPQWQNDLAAAYMNRGVARRGQGELAGAVRDYGVAIELIEQLLFIQQFMPVIPDLAQVFYNLLLLGQRQDLPAQFHPQQWREQATSFLQQLEQLVAIKSLPQHWRQKVEDLQGLLAGA